MLKNEKILLTGPTSQVALPLATALAKDNEVVGLARLSKEEDRERLRAAGVTPHAADIATDDFSSLADDFTYVLNFAVVRTEDFDYDLAANAEGLGRLMSRCRKAKGFLHSSSAAVYEAPGRKACVESDPLGDNHRCMAPTYSIAKIAAESMAKFAALEWNIPTTIARFSVPYGNNGGWPWYHLMMMKSGVPIPVHHDQPCVYNLIHEDDYMEQVPKLLKIASVPATVVNWASHEQTSIEEWCGYMAELTGLEVKFAPTDEALESLPLDTSRLIEKVGPTRVHWKDGIRRMVEARNPELLT
jgi:nucleoside-diphosphate-sugar epimerase